MTNIEKVKRILDAWHWVKVTNKNGGYIQTITSYHNNEFSYTDKNPTNIYTVRNPSFKDCTIEVIQRIPTAYKAWEKVLVLSNPEPSISSMEKMVWKICEVKNTDSFNYKVWDEDKTDYWILPPSCLAPTFDEDSLSGKEAKVTIDGKEYSVTLKLI
mgnify:CR=1 FL=1